MRNALIASVFLVGALTAAYFGIARNAAPATPVSYAERMGTRYTPVPRDLNAPPHATEIPIPASARGDAIWGGTGRDSAGHIWLGVSTQGNGGSAHLFEYAPESRALIDRGDVVSELKWAGVYRAGEGQIKIHTKIVQGGDGYLYFASFDEEGESDDATSKWGGHFWRLQPGSAHWQHLYAVPHGLVAVAGNGNWIYALGYWDHILYQYDTRKRTWREVRVGSVRSHVSRNIVVDRNGHAYVPRAREWRPGEAAAHPNEPFSAQLVEYDTNLKEVGNTPLVYYATNSPRDSHGLIGLSYLADGSIVVSTHVGYLYRITPSASGAARVEALGWIHPKGPSYAGSLFPIDDNRHLAAVVDIGAGHDWVVYDLLNRTGVAQKLPFDTAGKFLYGSSTRDDKGRFYVTGRQPKQGGGNKPLVLQIELPR